MHKGHRSRGVAFATKHHGLRQLSHFVRAKLLERLQALLLLRVGNHQLPRPGDLARECRACVRVGLQIAFFTGEQVTALAGLRILHGREQCLQLLHEPQGVGDTLGVIYAARTALYESTAMTTIAAIAIQ